MKKSFSTYAFLVLAISSLLFSMSSDGKNEPIVMKSIGEIEGYTLKNVWPDQDLMVDTMQYSTLKKEYLKRLSNNLDTIYLHWFWYLNRIDLDIYGWLMREGEVDFGDFKSTTCENILTSQLIIICKVISHSFDDRIVEDFFKPYYKTSCKVAVENVLYNRYFIKDHVPDTLIIKLENDLRNGWSNLEMRIGESYILFLSRSHMSETLKHNRHSKLFPLDANERNVFVPILSSGEVQLLKNLKVYDDIINKINHVKELGGEEYFFRKFFK